uniref:DNA-directed RNA polymerase n=1 Tax=viral metagenome TaxID=1070528 RepID=A0A6C0KB41_9ZZZZ
MSLVDSVPAFRTAHVKSIQFSVPTRDEIRRSSVVGVDSVSIYSKGVPVERSVNDLRMGTTDRRCRCTTCWNSIVTCTGHNGHIDLPFPVYHGAYVDTVLKVMRTICYFCGRPRLSLGPAAAGSTRKKHFLATYVACKSRKACVHCEMPCPQFVKSGNLITCKWPCEPPAGAAEFGPHYARDLFASISDSDWAAMGFGPHCRPENLVVDRITVASPCLRPSIVNDSRSRGQDDLTHCLQDINRQVQTVLKEHPKVGPAERALRELLNEVPSVLVDRDVLERLQNAVCSFANNQKPDNRVTQRSGNPLKTLKDRLVGKEGLVRGNMLGKRTNFSGRSVISPDPRLEIDEVGVPEPMARTLTIPVRVTEDNIHELRHAVSVGPAVLGGAALVVSRDGTEIDLEHCVMRDKIRLRTDGDIVHRYIRDGDPVIFNRQPSLHVGSMMCHRVKVIRNTPKEIIETIRLNPITAGPYNADFDGDEMNLHVPQSIGAIVEMEALMRVSDQIVSPQNNKPMMGLVQDSLTGIYMLSCDSVRLTAAQAMQIMGTARYFGTDAPRAPPPLPPPDRGERWSGNGILSMVLPPINVERPGLVIRDGVIVRGRLDKSNVGKSSGSIIHCIALDFGNHVAATCLSDLQNVVDEFLMCYFGLSCGISDCLPSAEARRAAEQVLQSSVRHIEDINDFVGQSKTIDSSMKEAAVLKVASNVLSGCGQSVVGCLDDDNNIYRMVNSGAKGNSINLTQIMAAVSQSCVDGRRILPHKSQGRNFPCFRHGDDSPLALGFIPTPYHIGLSPTEFFFHMMGGREGLVDTAVKTSVTGYMQRRLIKFTENLTVGNGQSRGLTDCTIVLNAFDSVCSFSYGADGFNPRMLQRVAEPSLTAPEDEAFVGMHDGERARLLALRREIYETFCTVGTPCKLETDLHLPVNVNTLLLYCRTESAAPAVAKHFNVTQALVESVVARHGERGSLLLRYHILYGLRRDQLCRRKVGLEALRELSDVVIHQCEQALAPAGMMVGCLSSQSVGEPLTQMNLNSFHLCLGKITGVSRVKEIVDVTHNMQAPCTTAVPIVQRDEFVDRLVRYLPELWLRDVVALQEVFTRGSPCAIDTRMLDGLWPSGDGGSGLGVVFVLQRRILEQRDLTMDDVARGLAAYVGDTMQLEATASLGPDWMLRLTLDETLVPDRADGDSAVMLEVIQHLLNQVLLAGVRGVTDAACRNVTYHDPSGQMCTTKVIDICGNVLATMLASEVLVTETLYSNDMVEVAGLFGVEAANACLLKELNDCISEDGTYINTRHLSTIADSMTYSGHLVPINRHGVSQLSSQPLQRCSFEETFDTATDAALFGYRDDMTGVSATMMFGKESPIGTCYNEVMHKPDEYSLSRRELEKLLRTRPKSAVERECKPEPTEPDEQDEPDDTNPFAMHSLPAYGFAAGEDGGFAPGSPVYGDDSPEYSPGSPAYGATSPGYGASSPGYGSSSPGYGAGSPAYGASSPAYGASSPGYGSLNTAYTNDNGRPGGNEALFNVVGTTNEAFGDSIFSAHTGTEPPFANRNGAMEPFSL